MAERLQKILSRAGISSRRKGETLIKEGRVTVDGKKVTELGVKVAPGAVVEVDGEPVSIPQSYLYVALYKPRGYVTTLHDPQGRPTVAELVAHYPARLYPVGRLDYASEGLLLMTNDGDFALRVQHPRYGVLKVYRVKVKGPFTGEDQKTLSQGVELADGFFRPERVEIEKRTPRNTWIKVALREGRNRVIRRALAACGFSVERLIRVEIGGVKLGDLKPGTSRELSSEEIHELLS